ncbi:exopolysaccharide biosynthesis protein [Chthonobacter rhizosphaerae]|uniref:exopolysaccharide biosynthesis protein n=1 Tax=Chthonobacter rhizosphaerae TaxID=2735553 RepID=UPI0015EE5757
MPFGEPPPFIEPKRPPSASTLLNDFAATWASDRVRLADIVDMLGDRVYGLILLIFAIPNAIPNPVPGVTAILGVPLVLVAAQQVMGRPRPWFPKVLGDRSIATEDFRRFVVQAEPWLKRVERLLRPRLRVLVSPNGERVLAAIALMMAVILTLPIPLANLLPALAICFIALAMIEYDGLMAAVGIVAAAGSVIIASSVVYGFVKIGIFLIRNALA